jgi:hypothetical protein
LEPPPTSDGPVLFFTSPLYTASTVPRLVGCGNPEAGRGNRGLAALCHLCRGFAVAAGFGLLHGLGFAGALAEVGLPTAEIPLALFSFNVGIELGQLAFVAAVLLVAAALRKVPVAWPRWVQAVPAYGSARWPPSDSCRGPSR